MAYYRLYFLGAEKRIASVVELHCDTDEAALATVRGHVDGRPMELWNEQRLVAFLHADGALAGKDETTGRAA